MAYKGKATDGTAKKQFDCTVWNGTQGKNFEMAMIAYFHALHEFFGEEAFRLVDVQRRRDVNLLNPETKAVLSSFQRDYDIVLAGKEKLPIIVEVKSSQARFAGEDWTRAKKEAFRDRFPRWRVTRTNAKTGKASGTSVHRQLLLDAVASVAVKIPGQTEAQQHASDYVWLWQDWKAPSKKRIKRRRDPGVSIWRQPYAAGQSAGDHLRERLRVLGASRGARTIIRRTLGVTSSQHKLPLRSRVDAVGLQRFGKLDWQSLIELPREGGSIKERFLAGLDEETRSNLRALEDARESVEDIQQHMDKAADYVRNTLEDFVGPLDWLEKIRRLLQTLEEKEEEILEQVDNKTLEYLIPDDVKNHCL